MNYFLIILFCCVVLLTGNDAKFIGRYCVNPNKEKIVQCAYQNANKLLDIYRNCAGSLKSGLSVMPHKEIDNFVCSKMNNVQTSFFNFCIDGAVWVEEIRGNKLTAIADWCLKQNEPQPQISNRWTVVVYPYYIRLLK